MNINNKQRPAQDDELSRLIYHGSLSQICHKNSQDHSRHGFFRLQEL